MSVNKNARKMNTRKRKSNPSSKAKKVSDNKMPVNESEAKWEMSPLTLFEMENEGVLPLCPLVKTSEADISTSEPRINRDNKCKTARKEDPSDELTFKGDFVLYRKCKSRNRNAVDPFTKLSDEIILYIFKWLPKPVLAKCAQVSKRWKNLSYDESLWKRCDLGKKHLPSGVLGTVIFRGVMVLRLASSEVISPVFLKPQNSINRFSKLQYLDLSMASISEKCLESLFSVCCYLKKLSLEHCQINDEICRYISANRDLEILNMSMCSGITATGIDSITSSCLRLNSWNLAWTDLSTDAVKVLSKKIPSSVTHLNISGHRYTLKDDCFQGIVDRCPNLVELDISDCSLLSENALQLIVSRLQRIDHLHFSRCYNIAPKYYLDLEDLRFLRKLDAFGVLTDVGLENLRQALSALEINKNIFSTVARPTVGIRRTSIWGLRVRD